MQKCTGFLGTMFDINEKVICVDDKFKEGILDYYNALPVKGKIYTVRDILPGLKFNMKESVAIVLQELQNRPNRHGIEPAFMLERFRELTTEEVKQYATVEEEVTV